MALPSILPPSGVPHFVESSQGITETDVYATVPTASGHSRKRPLRTAAERQVTVATPALSLAQMATFDAWFEDALQAGARAFAVPLTDEDSGGVVWWTARWLAMVPADPSNGRWNVTGTLVLSGEPSDTAPLSGDLAAEYGIDLDGSAVVIGATLLAAEYGIDLDVAQTLSAEYGIDLQAVLTSNELREDGSVELREDGTVELRESESV